MTKRIAQIFLLASSITIIGSSMALSFSCPLDILTFDKAVMAGPTVSTEVMTRAIKLRDNAEEQHKMGNHGGAVASINEALDLIGAE